MTNALVRKEPTQLSTVDDPILADSQLWDIVSSGDLKGLSPEQRAQYYLYRCRQEGLNPASQPFTYLVLNGKGVLYGNKTAADQLREVHGISIVDKKIVDDGEYITVEITVQNREGRQDFDIGSVFVGAAKGVERSNALMKAITKAKRRATYSICGTGVLDETEVETIVGSHGVVVTAERLVDVPTETADRETGEITTMPPLNLDDDIKRLRLALGWSDPQNVIDEARAHGINLRTRAGKQQMVDLLQSFVDAVEEQAEEAASQDSFIDAERHVAGEPGMDRHSA